MIEFSLLYALLVIFFSSLLPGALITLAILKDSEFSFLEKVLAGFGLGWILSGFFPFLLFILFGIPFSFYLAVFQTLLLNLIGIFLLVRAYTFSGIVELLKGFRFNLNSISPYTIFLFLLVFLSFYIRIQTLTPIYQELDPYYYLYISQQIIVNGFNPFDDGTAWYPHQVSHRAVPLYAYPIALWYVLYTSSYNHFILSYIGNLYPPLASALAVFFIYLLIRNWYGKEIALASAGIFSFMPIYLLKTLAGEAEIQPYAFFSLSMFLAFLSILYKKEEWRYAVIAGFAYLAVALGSASEIVASLILSSFFLVYSLFSLFNRPSKDVVKKFAVVLLFAALSSILKSIFAGIPVYLYFLADLFSFAVFSFIVYFNLFPPNMDKKEKLELAFSIIPVLLFIVLLFVLTPLNALIKPFINIGVGFAEFKKPLERTIAEQAPAGKIFYPQLGSIAIESSIFAPFSAIMNAQFSFLTFITNFSFGTTLEYSEKEPSLLSLLIIGFEVALLRSFLYSIFNNQKNLSFLLFFIFPIIFVGLIKLKYVIYLGFAMVLGLAFLAGELQKLFSNNTFYSRIVIILLGLLFFTQFLISPSFAIFKSSFGVRFQDDPIALKSKFTSLCNLMRINGNADPDLCNASKDPVGYANKGVNYQFSSKLCYYSLLSDPFDKEAVEEEKLGVSFRCERIAFYWIDVMEWIRKNSEKDARIISWWDYGHWINFFGQRNAVIRNEHTYHDMILEVAHAYIMGTPEDLKKIMKNYGANYALFDVELIGSAGFGGKFGALNYLACARNNQTDVSKVPGSSLCEFQNKWEEIYIPPYSSECSISFDEKGRVAYVITFEGKLEDKYCLGKAKLVGGQEIDALYYLDKRGEDGRLVLNKGFLRYKYTTQDGYKIFDVIYTKDPLWLVNGSVVSGWEDRKGRFYDSVLYRAFYLEDLPGFELVYKTPDNAVKIYKIKE